MDGQIDADGLLDDLPAPGNNNATLINETPDYTLTEYRELALSDPWENTTSDRLDGFHATVETSGWDETGEIRVDRTDPLLNDGVWPDEFEELRNDVYTAQFDMVANETSPDQKLNELFLDAQDVVTREWIINNYSMIRTMLLNGDVPNEFGNIGIDNGGFARGGAVTHNPERMNGVFKWNRL